MDFFHVHITDEAIKIVTDVLRSGMINEGEYVRRFEDALVPFVGRHPFAVSSCTAALHLALECGGVVRGEVLIPTQTFVATATAAVQAGYKPVFVDIDPHTGNISADDMLRKITPYTVAVMPVHFGGLPCDMDRINEIAKTHNLLVVEDAAHALGAKYKERPVGTLSDYTCFSFQAIKMLTTGDGGAITVPENKQDEVQAKKWFGINKKTVESQYNERLPSMKTCGFKYNMNNITAAIGLGNITQLANRLATRRRLARIYREELGRVSGLELMSEPQEYESAYWLFPVLVSDRPGFFAKMASQQIPVKVVNYGIDREPVFANGEYLPGQRYFDEHHMCIPLHEGLTENDVDYIIGSIKSGW